MIVGEKLLFIRFTTELLFFEILGIISDKVLVTLGIIRGPRKIFEKA